MTGDSRVHTLPSALLGTITRGHVHVGAIRGANLALTNGVVGDWRIHAHGPYLSNARNQVVREFLENFDHDVLLFMDSDMRPELVDFFKVLSQCRPDQPVVGGMYRNPTEELDPSGASCLGVVAYHWATDSEGKLGHLRLPYEIWTDDPDDPIRSADYVRVDAVGTGFMAIHRSLLVDFVETHPEPTPWFADLCIGDPLHYAGEDMSFCWRVRQAGHPVLLARCAKIGHHKEIRL